METLSVSLIIVTTVFIVVNYIRSKSLELVFLLGCGIAFKTILNLKVDRQVTEVALGLAMLGIGLEVSPKALLSSGRTSIVLAVFQLVVGAALFLFGGDWKPLGVAVLFQSTPLVAQITNRTTKEVRATLLGLMAIQDVLSGVFAAVAGSGFESVAMILVGYFVVAAAIFLVAGKSYQRLGGETLLEYHFERGIDPTEHSMRFVFVLVIMMAVGILGRMFGLGLPSSLFLLGFLLPTESETAQSRHHFESEIGKIAELGKGVFFLLLGIELEITVSVETMIMAIATLTTIVAVSTVATFLIVRKERTVVFRALLASGEFGPILLSALGMANSGVVLGIVSAMLLSSVGKKE